MDVFGGRRRSSGALRAPGWLLGAVGIGILALSGAQAADMRSVSQVPEALASVGAVDDLPLLLPSALGLDADSSLVVASTRSLPNKAGQVVRLNQLYRGVPVWGQQVVVQVSPANSVVYLTGTAVFDIGGEVAAPAPSLTADDALKLGKDVVARQLSGPVNLAYQNVVSDLVYYMDKSGLRLAYHVSFYTDVPDGAGGIRPTRPVYFFDANTGALIFSYENIQFDALGTGPGGNAKTGQWTWGTGILPKFEVTQTGGGNCTLDSTHILSENLNHTTVGSQTPYSFTCFNNTYQTINGGYSPLNDAQSFGLAVYNMYESWYSVPPVTQKLWMRVHYGTSYENAFWNGTSMAFGDGATTFYPLVGLDVTAHEISHGFTEQNSGLLYYLQSGGMNEAFSDMAGEAEEYFYSQTYGSLFPRTMPDFLVGAEIYKAPNAALRYMCDPTLDGYSVDNVSNYDDQMDVHYSSGIYNKAFCLLANTSGWNPRKAFDVFVLANQNYWVPNSTFDTGADGVVQAASVLGYSQADVKAAFTQVGIVFPGPANDNFVNAASILAGQTAVESNGRATKETGEPNHAGNLGGRSLWWKFVAPASEAVTIDTLSGHLDTVLAAYTGTAVDALAVVASNDDYGGGYASRIAFNAVAGTTYRIAVDGYRYSDTNAGTSQASSGVVHLAVSAFTNATIVTSSAPAAGGTTTGAGTYTFGSSRTVTASPASGYSFIKWTENGTQVSTNPSYSFTLNTYRNLVANFGASYVISLSASPSAGGHVSGGGTFASGTTQAMVATANSGYGFVNWTEGGTVVATTSTYSFTVTGARTLVAHFAPLYTVSLSATPAIGGTVAGGGTFVSGTTRTFVATPHTGYVFTGWTQNGSAVSSATHYTFVVSANRTLVAHFTRSHLLVNDLLVDFGASGLFERLNNGTWPKIINVSPSTMAVGDLNGNGRDDIVAVFGGGTFVRYDNAGAWVSLTPGKAIHLAIGDLDGNGKAEVVGDFPGGGLFDFPNNTAPWVRLLTSVTQGLTVGDLDGDGKDDIIAVFGGGTYVRYDNAGAWVRLTTSRLVNMAVGDVDNDGRADLVGDVAGQGLFIYVDNAGPWVKINPQVTQGVALGDLNGDGKDDVIGTFAAGTYVRYDNAGAWAKLSTSKLLHPVTLDFDNNGKGDLVGDVSGFGLYTYVNNAAPWVKLNSQVSEGVLPAGFN